MNRRTCASRRASLRTLRSRLQTCCSTALRALEQRPDRSYQLRTILNQLLGSRGEYIELGAADHKTEVLEQAADLVLEIGLDLDQERTARQQRPDRVAVDILI
jgi:hypothetical protein